MGVAKMDPNLMQAASQGLTLQEGVTGRARPVEGTRHQRPHSDGEVQHLPLRRPQGARDRSARPRLHGERGDDEDRAGDAVNVIRVESEEVGLV